MIIKNEIYGEFNIEEPVLVELLNSPALERLKGISQMGPPEEFYHLPVFSRYEHSVGVMLLVRKLGADLKEQVASLLHDASHTAFSHVIDFLWGDSVKEDFQDKNHLKILLRFGVDKILAKHNFDINQIADFENFSLLDQEIPGLCADRIDYTLQELHLYANPDLVPACINNLEIRNKRIVFKDLNAAKKFSLAFLERNCIHWTGFEAVSRYHQMALILKRALDKNFIQPDDIWENDYFVIKKLCASGDSEIISGLERLKNKKTSIKFGIVKMKKFRFIDPQILAGGDLKRLSEIDCDYKNFIEAERLKNAAGVEI